MRQRDHSLRLAVAELAAQPQRDIKAILAALPEEHSVRIATMLRDMQAAASPVNFRHLSPWLAKRLEQGDGMTAHALTSLKACARKYAVAEPEVIDGGPPSLLSRLFGSMLRRPA